MCMYIYIYIYNVTHNLHNTYELNTLSNELIFMSSQYIIIQLIMI